MDPTHGNMAPGACAAGEKFEFRDFLYGTVPCSLV